MTKAKAEKLRTNLLINDGVEELDADMRASDIIWSLEHLKFPEKTRLVRIDRHVRDHLVRRLRQR